MMSSSQTIAILGATGSIGTSTLDVLARHPERYTVLALSANRNAEKLAWLCDIHRPRWAVMVDDAAALQLTKLLRASGSRTEVLCGAQALCDVAASAEVDAVMCAIVGGAGLPSTLAAARAGKNVLLANKEALVMSGQIFMDAVATANACLLPIDSEHNAIFQSLPDNYKCNPDAHGVRRLLLTGSGGPFLKTPLEAFEDITPEDACKHPVWLMGRKISVDSATMMNKGLEVIEAHWLFGVPVDRIEVVIHPQSIVHSMVDYVDGSVVAQMGNPDMRIPIAHALAWPKRFDSGVAPLDLFDAASLSFHRPEAARFPCLSLAREALLAGGVAPTTLNAANEVAVAAFLERRLSFPRISEVIAATMARMEPLAADSVEEILFADKRARDIAGLMVEKRGCA